MRRRPTSLVVIMLFAVLAPAASGAVPDDPAPGTPEWHARDAANIDYSTQRQKDMMTNPAFGQVYWTEAMPEWFEGFGDQLQHPDRPAMGLSRILPGEAADPYRRHWDGARGVASEVEYLNRCGARIQGTVFAPKIGMADPVTGERMRPPFPGVVITTGSIQGYEEMYWWAAQGLAEAGYVTMTYDVMGQGESEAACPNGAAATGFGDGTIDALRFFRSKANPFFALIDLETLGLAGHSAGASAVTSVGNAPLLDGEPNPVDAVVGWDNAALPAAMAPRVPTMGQNAEYFFNPTPASAPPDPNGRNGTFRRFRDAGVEAMQIAHRGSTHLEWTYVPYILPASRDGERVAMYYTLAWFDRWLKGPGDATQSDDARRRLLATAFDESSDRSSIGAGTWDPATGNVPNTINGESVPDHLSIYYRSSYAFDGYACEDMRKGCA